jgi:hypothetical protein
VADLFLRGIKLDMQQGMSCPTRRCKFIDYEDLPTYSAAASESGTLSSEMNSTLEHVLVDSLPLYSIDSHKRSSGTGTSP